MHVERMGSRLIVQAPAKLNLFLEVLGRRPDGFHELETLMCPVSLYDSLEFEPSTWDGPIDFSCDWRPLARSSLGSRLWDLQTGGGSAIAEPPELPADQNNLVVRALDLLRSSIGSARGATVKLIKRIPAAAGLGGGSSDAAAALVAGNLGWQLKLPRERLHELAAQLGSDVPFFLEQNAVLCRGRGERLEPIEAKRVGWFVIVRPATGLSTAEVFRNWRPGPTCRSSEALLKALRAGRWDRVGRELHNALSVPAYELNADVARLRELFNRLDVWGHQMSGSGTSYFAICRHARHARQVAARLKNRRLGHVFVVRGYL